MENPIEQVSAMLAITSDRWYSFTKTLSTEFLNRKPASSEWSAVECLQHLIDAERVFQFRVGCFLKGLDFPAFDPDRQGSKNSGQTPAELAEEFGTLRRQSLHAIKALTEADLERRVRHQELGPVTLHEMLTEWAAHDLNHTIQAEKALIQPYMLECGPWIEYFQDHVVKEKA